MRSNLGPANILINNAGCALISNLTEGDTERWKRVLDLNVLCIATREAVENVNGHIIHINSVAGHKVPSVPNFNV